MATARHGNKIRVQLTLDPELVQALDRLCNAMPNTSKSGLIEQAMKPSIDDLNDLADLLEKQQYEAVQGRAEQAIGRMLLAGQTGAKNKGGDKT